MLRPHWVSSVLTASESSFVCLCAVRKIVGVSPFGGLLFLRASLAIRKWWLQVMASRATVSNSSAFCFSCMDKVVSWEGLGGINGFKSESELFASSKWPIFRAMFTTVVCVDV